MAQYTPSRDELLRAWRGFRLDLSDWQAEFERAIAKIEADALRRLTRTLADTGGFTPGRVIDTGHALWMIADEAARIEKEAGIKHE